MSGPRPDPYALWDAAYVLGSLSSAERRDYEAHLAGCADCRNAVAELSGVPPLLGLLDDSPEGNGVTAESAPLRPRLLEDLIAEVERRRRWSRRFTRTAAALAAAAIVALGGVVVWNRGSDVPPPEPPAASALTMVPVAPSELNATFTLTGREWGTDIDMTCTYHSSEADGSGEPPDRLAMVAVGRDGSRDVLATWMEHDGATALPTASTSLPMHEITSIQVVSAETGKVLLHRDL